MVTCLLLDRHRARPIRYSNAASNLGAQLRFPFRGRSHFMPQCLFEAPHDLHCETTVLRHSGAGRGAARERVSAPHGELILVCLRITRGWPQSSWCRRNMLSQHKSSTPDQPGSTRHTLRGIMTIFDDLRAGHAVQRTLARRMTHARVSPDHRREAFLALANELDAHATAEERHFYVLSIDGRRRTRRHPARVGRPPQGDEVGRRAPWRRSVDRSVWRTRQSNSPAECATTWTKRSTERSSSLASSSASLASDNWRSSTAPSTRSAMGRTRDDRSR